jgi:hypothetical protein
MAQQILAATAPALTRMEARGVPGWAEPLLRAARDTHKRAQTVAQRRPANWPVVHDLLADVAECLKQIESPSRTQYKPIRSWADAFDSPALTALDLTYSPRMEVVEKRASASGGRESNSGSWAGFDSGGDTGFDSDGGSWGRSQ